MGPPAFLPLRRKACWGFFSPCKIRRLRPGLNPRNCVSRGQHASSRPPKPLDVHCYLYGSEVCVLLMLMSPRCVTVYGSIVHCHTPRKQGKEANIDISPILSQKCVRVISLSTLPPGKGSGTHCTGSLVGPRASREMCGKVRCHRGSNLAPSSP
jgi:hypothetical protein